MKKIAFIILISLVFTACKKDSNQIDNKQNNKFSTQRVAITTVYNLMLVPNDPVEESVNLIMYDWAVQVKGLMSNQTTYSTMLNQLTNDADYTMSFEDLGITTSVTNFVAADGVIYEPYLWLYNGAKIVTQTGEIGLPILCIGTDIDPIIALDTNFNADADDGDFIAGWNKATNWSDEVFDEDEANSLTEPLFIVVYSEQGVPLDNSPNITTAKISHPVDPQPNYKRYWLKKVMMDERYERRTPRSEIRFAFTFEINGLLKLGKGVLHTRREKIHKNDLNVWKSCDHPLYYEEFDYTAGPYGTWGTPAIPDGSVVKIIGLLYEYDWWICMKERQVLTSSSNTVTIKYKSKNKGDVYQILSGQDLTYLNNGDSYIGSNLKILQDE